MTKSLLSILLLVTFALPAVDSQAAVAPTPAEKNTEPAKKHPLRGVVMGVYPDKSALMIKHEEIPGVMRAMTMLFKVDEATVKSAKIGQAVTGLLERQGDDWWLREVKLSGAPAK